MFPKSAEKLISIFKYKAYSQTNYISVENWNCSQMHGMFAMSNNIVFLSQVKN